MEVKAYKGITEPFTLAASGISAPFTVSSGDNTPIEVLLSGINTTAKGQFIYTITYPANAAADITLQKWPDLDDVSLNPGNVTQGNGKTQTLQLDVGSYLLTVLVSKEGLYAGISEAVHINSLLITVFTKDFTDNDFLSVRVPLSSDYTISGIGTFFYDGSAKSVSVTRKDGASLGDIAVYYEGTGSTTYEKSAIAPTNAGTYIITFDVEAVIGWSAMSGLPAGTIVIDYFTPAASDYTISGIGTFTYDGTERTVSITRKEDASPAEEITILYNGMETAPVNAGNYIVTFNVAAAPYWNAANGLSAGSIVINKADGAAVGAPTMASKTTTSITINAV